MKITLCITGDAESSGCSWAEVEKVVRRWASTYAASLLHLRVAPQGGMAITLDQQSDDPLSVIRELHSDLYELQVNFTVSFHF